MNQQEKSINHSNKNSNNNKRVVLRNKKNKKKIPKICLFSDPNPKKHKNQLNLRVY